MKRASLFSSTGLGFIAALAMAGIVHAETPSGIASSIGVVTAKPPVASAPAGTITIKPPNAIAAPEMPKMPDMPKMPEPKMPEMGSVGKATPPLAPAPSSPISDIMQHTHLNDMMNPNHTAPNLNEKLPASTKAFNEANSTMHQSMAIEMTGNADVDFVKGMIPHHQGAVDMAKVELQYGKDPEIKKFAEQIIKAQDSEIQFMKKWLASHPK